MKVKERAQNMSRLYPRAMTVVLILTALLLIALGAALAMHHSIRAMTVYAACCIGVLFIEWLTWRVFVDATIPIGHTVGEANLLALIATSLFGGFILEALTIIGTPGVALLQFSDWSVLRIGIFSACLYSTLLVLLVLAKKKPTEVLQGIANVTKGKYKAWLFIAVVALVVSCGLMLALSGVFHLARFPLFLYSLAVVSSALIFLRLIKQAEMHVERMFLAIALPFGMYMALAVPADTLVSWDDEIHYRRALAVSYVTTSVYTEADIVMFSHNVPNEKVGDPFSGTMTDWLSGDAKWAQSKTDEYHAALNQLHEDGESFNTGLFVTAPPDTSIANYAFLGYLPSAFGLWLARLIHLPFGAIFAFGRLANLLFYCFVVYWAIKITPTKKVLLAAFALLPTNLFLAANYSYDPWLTAFVLLGTAMLIRELCETETNVSTRNWALILLAFFLAFGPKAIYFPLVGLVLLVPRAKFASPRSRRKLICAAVLLAAFVAFTFVAPFISSGGASSTDLRGGSDVNSGAQLLFILNDPIEYFSILTSFIFNTYLTFPASDMYSMSFAYLGCASDVLPALKAVPAVALLIVAATDSNDLSILLARQRNKLWVIFVFFVTVALIATSLYVSYTPVGLDTVNGCQSRYLLPLLFPFLAFVFNFPVINKRAGADLTYGAAVLAAFGVIVLTCTWLLIASQIMVA